MSNEVETNQVGQGSNFAGVWLSWEDTEGYHRWTTWEIRGMGQFTVKEINGRGRYAERFLAGLRYHTGSQRGPVTYDITFSLLKPDVIRLRDPRHREGAKQNDAIPEINTLWYRKGSDLAYEVIRANSRVLVKDWVTAIACGDARKTEYIEETAGQMRYWSCVVRYLVYQLSQTFPLDDDPEAKKKDGQPPEKGRLVGQNSQEVTARVHRRVARLLAEMSEGKYFTGADNEVSDPAEAREKVKKELINHAVPAIVTRLPIEGDLEIRRDLATVLGKLGQDESTGAIETVNALVRAVVSDEKARASRQEMLAKYYLEPSWEQSRQAATILEGAVNESKRTLRLLQTLNVVVFLVGMTILVGGLYISVTSSELGSRVGGALAGLGGLAGVVTMLVKDPLNHIQNSLSNLVQLESAFTSFIWELNLNSTFIQSQYVAAGKLEDKDITQTINHIEGAMDFVLSQLAAYTEEGREVIVPHLTQLSPVVGQPGDSITVYGTHLRLSGRAKEWHNQIVVAINHVPSLKLEAPEKRDAVDFSLPVENELPESLDPGDETAWISLIINGVETNALPLHVRKGQPTPAENKDNSNGRADDEDAIKPAEPSAQVNSVTAVKPDTDAGGDTVVQEGAVAEALAAQPEPVGDLASPGQNGLQVKE